MSEWKSYNVLFKLLAVNYGEYIVVLIWVYMHLIYLKYTAHIQLVMDFEPLKPYKAVFLLAIWSMEV